MCRGYSFNVGFVAMNLFLTLSSPSLDEKQLTDAKSQLEKSQVKIAVSTIVYFDSSCTTGPLTASVQSTVLNPEE